MTCDELNSLSCENKLSILTHLSAALLIQLKNHLRASEKAAQKVKIKETT
jgi:hypothetical protein